MRNLPTTQLKQEITSLAQRNLDLFMAEVMPMSAAQLDWKPSSDTWNARECVAHLNWYAKYYHSAILNRLKDDDSTIRTSFSSSPLGRAFYRSMKLGNAANVKRRMKSPKASNPLIHPELLDGHELEQCKGYLEEFPSVVEQGFKHDIRKLKIPVSISRVIKLNLGDLFLVLAYHSERHLQQVMRLKAHKNFPS